MRLRYKVEILRVLKKLENAFDQERVQVETLKNQVDRLERQNRDLLDRVMSRSYEELRTYAGDNSRDQLGEYPGEDYDEDLAGEVIDLPI